MAFMNRFKVSSGFKSMIRKLISIEFTVILLFVLIPIVVVGSFIPQDRTFAEYTNAYGFKLASILYQTYLTSLFTSPWFFILIFLLFNYQFSAPDQFPAFSYNSIKINTLWL